MKLQCKICGNSNLKCEENQIICNDCGCKYPLEEAKNLINKTDENNLQQTKNFKIPENIVDTKQNNIWKEFIIAIGIFVAFLIFLLSFKKEPIKLTDENFKEYISIKDIVTIEEENDYTYVLKIETNMKSKVKGYKFENVSLIVFATVQYTEIIQTKTGAEPKRQTWIGGSEFCSLNQNGETQITLNPYILKNGQLSSNPINVSYSITVLSGDLIPE